jgi:hypothetical protein
LEEVLLRTFAAEHGAVRGYLRLENLKYEQLRTLVTGEYIRTLSLGAFDAVTI